MSRLGLADPMRDQLVGVVQLQLSSIGLIDIMRVVLAINIILLFSLVYVWAKNAWMFRSKHTMGMFMFAALLLAENGLAFYLFVFHTVLSAWIANPGFVPPIAQYAMLSIRILELLGLLFLTWITWD